MKKRSETQESQQEAPSYGFDVFKIIEHGRRLPLTDRTKYLADANNDRRLMRDAERNRAVRDASLDEPERARRLGEIENEWRDFHRTLQIETRHVEKLRTLEANGSTELQPANSIEPIQWQGSQADLVFTIYQLIRLKLLSDDKKWRMCTEHFVDRNGKPFTAKGLSSAFASLVKNKDRKSKLAPAIEKALNNRESP